MLQANADMQKYSMELQIRQTALMQAPSTLKYPYTVKELLAAAKKIEAYLKGHK